MSELAMKHFQLIYKTLQDKESRLIWEKRFMYSVTKNEAYIAEMIHCLIDRYGTYDAVYCLLQWIQQKKNKRKVIWGAGCACRHLLWILRTYGIMVDYICDNNENLHNKIMYGKKVISPMKLKKIMPEVCIIVGVNWYSNEIVDQLKELGADFDNVFVSQHGWWLGKEKQYFDADIMKPGKQEVFVDGGAYTGEDSLEFFRWCQGQNGYTYLFEPDKKNYRKCVENMILFEGKVEVFNKGLWSRVDQLAFLDDRNASSSINENGDITVQTMTIDEISDKRRVSFIKMDVEGAELEALKGAAQTIQRNKPKLAICVYHKPEDILDIPKYILELNSDYRLFLRHYSYTPTETVLYAI